jgi:hypothetical protein
MLVYKCYSLNIILKYYFDKRGSCEYSNIHNVRVAVEILYLLYLTRLTLVEIIYDLACLEIDVHDTKRNI